METREILRECFRIAHEGRSGGFDNYDVTITITCRKIQRHD
jgi:hypothetical protein